MFFFCKKLFCFRNPTPDVEDSDLENLVWKPYTKGDHNCLIMAEKFTMGGKINEERMKFWEEIKENLSLKVQDS